MTKYDYLPYRPCVGIMLLNKEGFVFVGKRIDVRQEAWQMPQGGIDEGEEPKQAALRELAEETAIKDVEIEGETKDWYSYDLPETLVPVIWGGKYRGQKQKWFKMRYKGDGSDININTKDPEFLDWKWEYPSCLYDLIVPFKRELYQKVIRELL